MLTQAMYHARELAMTRMEEEADQLGADGIVGVRLDIGRYEWGADLAEFIAVGTAVKHRGGELHRAPNGRPFTSRPERPGLRDATARRLPPGRAGDGQLRLPRRPPGDARVVASRSGATSRCRTSPRRCTRRASSRWGGCRTEADAGPGRRDRRRADRSSESRLGLARDRVLRDRDRGRRRPASDHKIEKPATGAAADRLSAYCAGGDARRRAEAAGLQGPAAEGVLRPRSTRACARRRPSPEWCTSWCGWSRCSTALTRLPRARDRERERAQRAGDPRAQPRLVHGPLLHRRVHPPARSVHGQVAAVQGLPAGSSPTAACSRSGAATRTRRRSSRAFAILGRGRCGRHVLRGRPVADGQDRRRGAAGDRPARAGIGRAGRAGGDPRLLPGAQLEAAAVSRR